MLDIISVGSSTFDVFLKLNKCKSDKQCIELPLGGKLLIERIYSSTGGGAINPVFNLKKMGFKVGVVSGIGNDAHGHLITHQLADQKIKFLGHLTKKPTDYSVIIDGRKGDRTILTNKSASKELSFSKLNKNRLISKWFYIATLIGKSFYSAKKLAQYSGKNNIKIAFNPTSYLAEKGRNYLAPILSRTSMLVLNKEEASLLSKESSIISMSKRLLSWIKKDGLVLITDGKNGAYCYDGNNIYHILPKPIKVVGQTGAGDCFTATFLGAYYKKKDIKFALHMAQCNVESILSSMGAHEKSLTWGNLIKRMKKRKFVITKKTLAGK